MNVKPTRNASSIICYLLVVLVAHRSLALLLTPRYSEQDPDPNTPELRCEDLFGLVSDAKFFVSLGDEGDEVEEIQGDELEDGVIRYTITPETEGRFWCSSGDEKSDEVTLAAKPRNSFDCSSEDEETVSYQLLSYSKNNLYFFDCTVQPGAVKSSYKFDSWRFRKGVGLIPHNTWDRTTYQLKLRSQDFARMYKYQKRLECRVDITHALKFSRAYCGQSIRAAVGSNIIQHLHHNMAANSNSDLELTCAATGSELEFTWSYDNKIYTLLDNPCNEDSNEPCVEVTPAVLDPARVTSHLRIPRDTLVLRSRVDVTCEVSQNLDVRFGPQILQSHGTVTVLTIQESEETKSPPVDEVEITIDSMNDSKPVLNAGHISAIIVSLAVIIVIIAVALIAVCGIAYYVRYKGKQNCKERRDNINDDGVEEDLVGNDNTDGVGSHLDPRQGNELSTINYSRFNAWHIVKDVFSINGSNGHRLRDGLLRFIVIFPPNTGYLKGFISLGYLRVNMSPEKFVSCRTNGECYSGEGNKKTVYELMLVNKKTGSQIKVCSVRSKSPTHHVMYQAINQLQLPPVDSTSNQGGILETNINDYSGTTGTVERNINGSNDIAIEMDQVHSGTTMSEEIGPTRGLNDEPTATVELIQPLGTIPSVTMPDNARSLETREDQSEPLETKLDQSETLETRLDISEPLETRLDQS